jgi:Zn-dependent protease
MSSGSARLGTIAGIRINVHWSVAVIVVLLAASLARSVGWTVAFFGVFGFLGSVLAHELGHALTARRFGVGTESIQLWALGGAARLDREAPSARADGWIAAAGPIVNVVVAGFCLAVWEIMERGNGAGSAGGALAAILGWLGIINAFLALFNLLPGAPLDGGRVLRAVRWAMHGDRRRAAIEAGRAGQVLGWSIAALGFVLLLQTQSAFWLLITGVFIAVNAKVEIAAAGIARRLDGVKVRDLTWFGVASAGADMDADSMLWQRQRLGQAGGVTVTDAEGHLQGLVLEDDLWAIPTEHRPWVMLTQMMVPLERTAQAAPDDDLSSVLGGLNMVRPVVTVWEEGRLVGMVPPRILRDRLRAAGL